MKVSMPRRERLVGTNEGRLDPPSRMQASAFSLFGDDGAAEKNYVAETTAMIGQVRVRRAWRRSKRRSPAVSHDATPCLWRAGDSLAPKGRPEARGLCRHDAQDDQRRAPPLFLAIR